ncbi:uncharacterized protein CEXT_409201 [Caerostris extrusa]|uniref:Uncharacterized protein n=1 Tax=Caerostris extrusa TaxID=172846 RepID=A0AAV4VE24_CAEEX|nr:uncharacterized protein CEXT_409201 [Caerostris extrusa]
MNVFPKEAPIYGGGRIVVELYNELPRKGANYYLVFKGSQLRHTSCADSSWNNGYLQLSTRVPIEHQCSIFKNDISSTLHSFGSLVGEGNRIIFNSLAG